MVLPALFFGILSCEETLDISFTGNSDKRLVVEGSITTDTMAHQVILSYSGDFFNTTEQEMATGAEVNITNGVDTFYLNENPAGSGIYLTEPDVYGETDKTYMLNVKLADGKAYSASDYLNPCAYVDSISQSYNYNSLMYGYGYDVMFYAQEPEPANDCYMFLIYLDDVLYSDTITQVSFVDDEYVNGNYISNMAVYHILEEDISDSVYVTLELYSTSREFYDFMYALMLETVWKGSPWDGPPANIPTNISNEGLGYFRASDVKRTSRHFVPKPRVN